MRARSPEEFEARFWSKAEVRGSDAMCVVLAGRERGGAVKELEA